MATDTKEKTKEKTTKKVTSAKWRDRYNLAANNQEQMFQKFANFYDIMYAVFNDKNMAPWRSKVYIPILGSKAWDLVAKFISLKPGFEVSVRDELPEDGDNTEIRRRATKMQKKLEYDYDNPLLETPIRDKLLNVMLDATVTGTGLCKVDWKTIEQKQYMRPLVGNGQVDLSREVVRESITGCNDITPVNIFNVFIAPSSHELQQAHWVIIREFKTLFELKEENKGVPIYKNLELLKGIRASSDRFAQYKKSRNRLSTVSDPISEDQTVDQIEIFECYDRETNEILTYAAQGKKGESWVEIRRQDNPFWHGKFPLVPFYLRRKPYEFWGESIFETTERVQAAINDIFNHYMDNWNLSIDGMIMTEENSYVSDFVVEPGGEFTYRNEQPKQFKFPEPNPTQLSIVMNVLEKSIEQATISQFSSGIPDSSMDKTAGTATGIMRIQEAANEKIGFMRSNFMKSLKQIGFMWMTNNQQFMDQPLSIDDVEGELPLIITPEDLQGIMDLRIDDASMEPLSKQEKRAMHLEWVAHMMQLQQASIQQAQLDPQSEVLMFDFEEISNESSQQFAKKVAASFVHSKPIAPPQEEGQEDLLTQLGGQGE